MNKKHSRSLASCASSHKLSFVPLVVVAFASASLTAWLVTCRERSLTPVPTACICPETDEGSSATDRFLADNAIRYRKALKTARAWLDKLKLDPAELRAANIKGKKKLVELLDTYVRLFGVATAQEKPALSERIKQIVAVTYTPGYHDLLLIGDKAFKQDATSYLRAAYLMDTLGLDTSLYRQEIRKIHQRLNDHMESRGPHQRMAFHWYYSHFGLKEPFDLASGFKSGIIASRLDPYRYRSVWDVYGLTHEVFVPYQYGEMLNANYFDADDRAYLRHTLNVLTSYYILKRDPDLVAELVSCLRYVKATDLPVYRDGLEFLLSSQLPDGKWGQYESFRKRYGDLVEQGWYLHTTAVAVDALTIAFHFNDDETSTRR